MNTTFKKMAILLCGTLTVASLSGCGSSSSNKKPSIYLESYQKTEYETTTVQTGDIAPVFELSLTPDEYEVKSYSIEQSDYEVGEVFVKEGDYVEEGDILIQFLADEIQETIDEYTKVKEEDEMLLEHYKKLMAIDSSQDYTSEIRELTAEIEVAETYIDEKSDKYSDYTLVAEKAGTVTYVNEWLEEGYVSANDALIKVASGSSNYTAETTEEFTFKEGDIYEASYELAVYEMKVISVSKKTEETTGKTIQTIVFEPVDDMSGVSITETLSMTINMTVLSNVTYVKKQAIYEKAEEGNYYVYVLDDEGYRSAEDVTIGDTVDGSTKITSGVEAGEQVTIN